MIKIEQLRRSAKVRPDHDMSSQAKRHLEMIIRDHEIAISNRLVYAICLSALVPHTRGSSRRGFRCNTRAGRLLTSSGNTAGWSCGGELAKCGEGKHKVTWESDKSVPVQTCSECRFQETEVSWSGYVRRVGALEIAATPQTTPHDSDHL